MRVKEALQREIEVTMKPGDALPTEPRLEQRFGVSRITVRRALDELASDGLIVRQQGRGTFVRELPITQDLTEILSWTTAMRRLGYEPQTMTCEIDVIEPGRWLGATLNLGLGQRALRVRRVRGADGEPICLMTNYLPEGTLPGLVDEGLREDSMYATLAAHGMYPARVEDTVEARPATDWEAALLWVEPGSPLLQVTRVTYDALGRPLDVAVVGNRADRHRYTVHFAAGVGVDSAVLASPVREKV